MRKPILFIYFLIAVLLRATSQGGEIQARAFWAGEPFGVRYDEPLPKAINIDVIVQFRNVGDADETLLFRKAPKDLIPMIEKEEIVGGLIYYRVSYDTVLGGGDRIPSIIELSPVRLGPGEMTEFRFSIRIDAKVPLNRVEFRYEVDPRFAKRFSGWSGAVETMVQRQAMNKAWPADQSGTGSHR
ncbi:MAG TPA: hypothetical protein VMC06_15295 [Opitutaceae bacterium]|nr:hypothetical protein [Opitutaceae bacterium]